MLSSFQILMNTPVISTTVISLMIVQIPAVVTCVTIIIVNMATLLIFLILSTLSFHSDVDECSSDVDYCHTFADCTNTAGSYVCQCRDGYHGDGIEICQCK